MYHYLQLIFVLTVSSGLSAQATFGIRGGLDLREIESVRNGQMVRNEMAIRFNIGVDFEFPIIRKVYLQPGLIIASKGTKSDAIFLGEPYVLNTTLNYLEVPVNLVYKPKLGRDNLVFSAGIYGAYGLGGRFKYESVDWSNSGATFEDVKFGNDEAADFKQFDAGGNVAIGYMFSNEFSILLNGQFGVYNIFPDGDLDNSARNNGFGISAGYRF
jgi:hypothetical protein